MRRINGRIMFHDMNYDGGKPGYDTINAEIYLLQHPDYVEFRNSVHQTINQLVSNYDKCLTARQIGQAKASLYWKNYESLDEVKRAFLTNVLMNAYQVFDATRENYEKILVLIQKFNPEFESAFVQNHKAKLERYARVHSSIG